MHPHPFRRLADWQMRHRRGLILGLIALSAFAAAQLADLEFDFRPEALIQFSEEEQAFARQITERFQIDTNILLVLLRGSRPEAVLDERGLSLLHQLTETIDRSDVAAQVISLTRVPRRDPAGGLAALTLGRLPPLINSLPITPQDVARVRAQVAGSRILPGQLVSRDGSTAAIAVVLAPPYDDHSLLDRPLAALQAELREVLTAGGPTLAAPQTASYEVHFGGLPFVRVETVRSLKSEQRLFWPLIAALYLTLLWLLYRDLALATLPLIAVGLATLWGMALLPLTGSSVNVVNNIVPTLILVIGVCNAIHMLHAYVEARRDGADGDEAVRKMMQELALPAFLTSLTTAIGFASLVVARNPTLRDLGWQAAAGILFSYLALVTLLPVAAGRFGKSLSGRRREEEATGALGMRWLERTVAAVLCRPRSTLALWLAVLAAAVAVGSRVPVDATFLETFPPGHPVFESHRVVEEELGGVLPLEIHLRGPAPGFFAEAENLRHLFEIQQAISAEPEVLAIHSAVDLIAEIQGAREAADVTAILTPPRVAFSLGVLGSYQPETLAQLLTADRSEARLAARLGDDGIRASKALLDRIEAAAPGWLAGFDGEVELRLTGEAFMGARGLEFFIRDLFLSLLTASGVIFIVLVLVFRSWRMGLLSVLPNLLPLALTLGLMPLFGYQLNTTTAIVFTISIGMAVDNTIHLLARFRLTRRAGHDLEEAIRETFRKAGVAVVTSNLLLVAGFTILFASDFEPVYRVAVLISTTIAAALVAAVLVVPEMLLLFGWGIGKD